MFHLTLYRITQSESTNNRGKIGLSTLAVAVATVIRNNRSITSPMEKPSGHTHCRHPRRFSLYLALLALGLSLPRAATFSPHFATGAQHTIMPSKPSLTRKTIVLLLDSVFPALPGHSISSTITTSTTCYWSKPIRSRAGILLAKKTTKALSGKKDTVLASLDSRNEYHSDWYRPTPVHSGSSTRTGKLRETSLPTCTRYLPIFPAICSISIS